jgi:hypothetical protein
MLNIKTTFVFYLAAFICFVLAALGEGALARRRVPSRLVLLPLGLALWLFPLMWNTGDAAFK